MRSIKKKKEEKVRVQLEERKMVMEKLRKRLERVYGGLQVQSLDKKKRKRVEQEKGEKRVAPRMDKDILSKLDPELVGMLTKDEFCIEENSSREIVEDEFDDSEDEDRAELKMRTIFYCSRTHSQLSQFVSELKKTVHGESVKLVSLGSRHNMCVNEKVKKSGRVNEACLDLQEEKDGCFFHKSGSELAVRDHLLLKNRDIEESVKIGRNLSGCPYYASRKATKYAQVVTLPYAMLLHKETRESLKIDLKRNVIVFDEAHNLIETLNQLYSFQVDLKTVALAKRQITQYLEKYERRMKETTSEKVKGIVDVANLLFKFLAGRKESEMHTINEFVFQAGLEAHNFFEVDRFVKDTNLVNKLKGFLDYIEIKDNKEQNSEEKQKVDKHNSPFSQFVRFLSCLNNRDDDGRIFVSREENSSKNFAQFLLLNPEQHFASLLKEAKAVVLAGGTLSPKEDFVARLFGSDEICKPVRHFSCGHIIPDSNLLTMCVPSGPSGISFDFRFDCRSNPSSLSYL